MKQLTIYLTLFLFSIYQPVSAQTPCDIPNDEAHFSGFDTPAEFPGGDKALVEFINDNLIYPNEAAVERIGGTVHVEFTVNRYGIVDNIRVVGSVHPELDQEAVRVIRVMPNWKPATLNKEPVECYFRYPIGFKNTGNKPLPTRFDYTVGEFPKTERDYYNDGTKRMKVQQYECAEWLLSKCIELRLRGDALYNRAICRYYLGNTHGACADLYLAAKRGDADSKKLFKEKCGQYTEEELNQPVVVEKSPAFPGGMEALITYLKENLAYPEGHKPENGGTVVVIVTIKQDGTITDPVIDRGLSPEYNELALRLISSMPKWIPGTKDGQPADMPVKLPVRF